MPSILSRLVTTSMKGYKGSARPDDDESAVTMQNVSPEVNGDSSHVLLQVPFTVTATELIDAVKKAPEVILNAAGYISLRMYHQEIFLPPLKMRR